MAFDFGSAYFAWTATNYLHLKQIYWFWLFIISYHRRSVKLDSASACVHCKEILPNEMYWPSLRGKNKSHVSSTSLRTGTLSVWVFQETDTRMESHVQKIYWGKKRGEKAGRSRDSMRPWWESDSYERGECGDRRIGLKEPLHPWGSEIIPVRMTESHRAKCAPWKHPHWVERASLQ